MLVIISDLHLTDGTSCPSVAANAFQVFAQRLVEMAHNASWRADGGYRPIDGIDLVLLGDVLDPMRSASWLSGMVRPWTDSASNELLLTVRSITAEILRHNEPAMAILRGLSAEGLPIAAANRAGQPAATATQAVQVRTHYMAGNHDWFYHLPGEGYDALRQGIARQMGLAYAPGGIFAHDAAENPELQDIMRRHKVLARHGDIFDPLNFSGDRDTASVGDAIVVELVTRFASEVSASLGDELPTGLLQGLRELDNVRPLLVVPVWIDGLLDRMCPWPGTRTKIKRIWDRLVDEFLSLSIVRDSDSWNAVEMVDGLQLALKLSRRAPTGWVGAVADWMERLTGTAEHSYYKHALAEPDFRNRRARHVVYGHTHVAESVPLDASFAEQFVLNQLYFNSGTWRRVHRQTRFAPGEHEFIPAETMTLSAFYAQDERGGRPYETWSGMLGLSAAETTGHRVDVPAAAIVPRPSGATPLPAPHFSSALLRARS